LPHSRACVDDDDETWLSRIMAPAMRRLLNLADPPPREPDFIAANRPEQIAAAAPEGAAVAPEEGAAAPAIASAEWDDPVWMGRLNQRSLVEIRAVSGPGAGRVWPLGMGVHDIGPAPGSAIEITGHGVPERGVQVKIGPTGQAWLLLPSDAAGTAPVRVNVINPLEDGAVPRRETGEMPWPIRGDLVLGEVLLRVTSPSVADAAVTRSSDGPGYDYIRAPRAGPPLPGGRFRLPHPPAVPPCSPISAGVTVAPVVVVGIGIAWLLRSFFFLVFVLISSVFAVTSWISGRRAERRAFWTDLKTYWEGRGATNAAIRHAIAQERKLRCDTLMDPAYAALTAIGPGRRLWERRRGDADHLVLRVGTLTQPSMIEIEDPSRQDAQRIFRWNLPDVPLAVDLAARGVLGLVGEDATTRAIAAWMVVQAAVLHSPRDVRIYLLADISARDSWDWVRWLPHAGPGGERPDPMALVGNDPEQVAGRIKELVSVINSRDSARSATDGSARLEPDIVVVFDGASRFRQVAGVIPVLRKGPALGVFSICLDKQERFLPRECTGVVGCDPAGVTVSQQDLPDFTGIRPDLVTRAWCDRVASSLTELRDVTMVRDAAPARPGTRLPG
jgi:S-DNA-T family DNA segregation ATPase FtsK/SpoIIIE